MRGEAERPKPSSLTEQTRRGNKITMSSTVMILKPQGATGAVPKRRPVPATPDTNNSDTSDPSLTSLTDAEDSESRSTSPKTPRTPLAPRSNRRSPPQARVKGVPRRVQPQEQQGRLEEGHHRTLLQLNEERARLQREVNDGQARRRQLGTTLRELEESMATKVIRMRAISHTLMEVRTVRQRAAEVAAGADATSGQGRWINVTNQAGVARGTNNIILQRHGSPEVQVTIERDGQSDTEEEWRRTLRVPGDDLTEGGWRRTMGIPRNDSLDDQEESEESEESSVESPASSSEEDDNSVAEQDF